MGNSDKPHEELQLKYALLIDPPDARDLGFREFGLQLETSVDSSCVTEGQSCGSLTNLALIEVQIPLV